MTEVSEAILPAGGMREQVLGVPVDVLNWNATLDRIFAWTEGREGRTVCVCDVHSIVVAQRDRSHAAAIRAADLVTPDGAPVAWLLRRRGHRTQGRISGPDLMLACCRKAAELGTEVFLYGGTPITLRNLEENLRARFRGINIVGSLSPPFRPLSPGEDAAIVETINRSGARIVWVGLGCPKQEAWLLAHQHQINAVMIGVGAAFDFHAGVVKRAPGWMQRSGLEWFHRILQDPKRLAKRYLVSNTMFVLACCGARWPEKRLP